MASRYQAELPKLLNRGPGRIDASEQKWSYPPMAPAGPSGHLTWEAVGLHADHVCSMLLWACWSPRHISMLLGKEAEPNHGASRCVAAAPAKHWVPANVMPVQSSAIPVGLLGAALAYGILSEQQQTHLPMAPAGSRHCHADEVCSMPLWACLGPHLPSATRLLSIQFAISPGGWCSPAWGAL